MNDAVADRSYLAGELRRQRVADARERLTMALDVQVGHVSLHLAVDH